MTVNSTRRGDECEASSRDGPLLRREETEEFVKLSPRLPSTSLCALSIPLLLVPFLSYALNLRRPSGSLLGCPRSKLRYDLRVLVEVRMPTARARRVSRRIDSAYCGRRTLAAMD